MNNYEIDTRKNIDESATNTEASSFSCDKCEQNFRSQLELKEHGRSAHQLL